MCKGLSKFSQGLCAYAIGITLLFSNCWKSSFLQHYVLIWPSLGMNTFFLFVCLLACFFGFTPIASQRLFPVVFQGPWRLGIDSRLQHARQGLQSFELPPWSTKAFFLLNDWLIGWLTWGPYATFRSPWALPVIIGQLGFVARIWGWSAVWAQWCGGSIERDIWGCYLGHPGSAGSIPSQTCGVSEGSRAVPSDDRSIFL